MEELGYVIIDLEFNNMKDVEDYCKDNKHCDENCPNEIIEIGAVKLDKYLKELDRLRIYIKPSKYDFLNPKIKEITGITEECLRTGISFKEALARVKEFVGDNILCSWAKDDIAEIIRNANYHNCDDGKWIKRYVDLQEYYMNVLGEKRSISLKKALGKFKINLEENSLHDALNDALYTAEVFRKIYNYRILKTYIKTDIFDMPVFIVIDYKELNKNELRPEYKCPKCSGEIIYEYDLKLLKWRFITVGCCQKCRTMLLSEIVIKKSLNGKIIYNRNIKALKEFEYMYYRDKINKK